MPRGIRIEFSGAWYHVSHRSIEGRLLYNRTQHFTLFFELLEEVARVFQVEIHGYCLLSHEYHLVVRTLRANLSSVMRHLNSVYTQRLNRLEGGKGQLFSGRYRALLFEPKKYLGPIIRFIHWQPVMQYCVERPHEYLWSSYGYYLQSKKTPHWFITEVVIQQKRDKDFLKKKVDLTIKKIYETSFYFKCLGSHHFLQALEKNQTIEKSTFLSLGRKKQPLHVEALITFCADFYGIEYRRVLEKRHGFQNKARILGVYLARKMSAMSTEALARLFHFEGHSGFHYLLQRAKELIQKDVKFKEGVMKGLRCLLE